MVLDFRFKALFSSNSITCIPWLPLLEIRTWLPALDCLEAFRFDLHYRIAWRVQQNHGKGYGKATAIRAQLSHSRAGVAVTSSWLCGYTCLASVCITATVYCQSMYAASWILPRHQHLWCYFLEEFLAKEYILPSIGLRNGYVVHFSPVRQSRAPVSQVQNGQAHFKRFQIAKRSVTYILWLMLQIPSPPALISSAASTLATISMHALRYWNKQDRVLKCL